MPLVSSRHLIGRMRVKPQKSKPANGVCLTPTGGSVYLSRRGYNTSEGTPSARLGRWTGSFFCLFLSLDNHLILSCMTSLSCLYQKKLIVGHPTYRCRGCLPTSTPPSFFSSHDTRNDALRLRN